MCHHTNFHVRHYTNQQKYSCNLHVCNGNYDATIVRTMHEKKHLRLDWCLCYAGQFNFENGGQDWVGAFMKSFSVQWPFPSTSPASTVHLFFFAGHINKAWLLCTCMQTKLTRFACKELLASAFIEKNSNIKTVRPSLTLVVCDTVFK